MAFTSEAVILFLGVLLLAFFCGFIRSLRQYFARNQQPSESRAPRVPGHNLVIAHISASQYHRDRISFENDVILNGAVFPGEAQISPPPYSAVSNILPPSYDEAVKQSSGQETGTSSTPDDNKV